MNAPRYTNRKPGCNPRTGERLPHWREVQVEDPALGAFSRTPVKFAVKTENGSRLLVLNVPHREGAHESVALDYAKALGFQVLNIIER